MKFRRGIYIPSDYTLGYWGLNGNSIDSSKYKNNGSNTNIAYASEYGFGNRLGATFIGSSQIATSYIQTSITDYTISCWMKSSSATQGAIFQDRGSGAGESLTLSFNCSYGGNAAPGKVSFGLDTNSVYVGVISNVIVNDGNWHCITGVFSGGGSASTSQFRMYVDGIIGGVGYEASANTATTPFTGLGGAIIGYHNAWNIHYIGDLSEIVVESRSWSSAEISYYYEMSSNFRTNDFLKHRYYKYLISPQNQGPFLVRGYYPGHYRRIGDTLVRPWIQQPNETYLGLPIISSIKDSTGVADGALSQGDGEVSDFLSSDFTLSGSFSSSISDISLVVTGIGGNASGSIDDQSSSLDILGSGAYVNEIDFIYGIDTYSSSVVSKASDSVVSLDSVIGLAMDWTYDFSIFSDSLFGNGNSYIADYSIASDFTSESAYTYIFDSLSSLSTISALGSVASQDAGAALDTVFSITNTQVNDTSSIFDAMGSVVATSDFYDFITSTDTTTVPGAKILYDYGNTTDTVITLGIVTLISDSIVGTDVTYAKSSIALYDSILESDTLFGIGTSSTVDTVFGADYLSAISLSIYYDFVSSLSFIQTQPVSTSTQDLVLGTDFYSIIASTLTRDSIFSYDTISPLIITSEVSDFISATDITTIPGIPSIYDYGNVTDTVSTLGILTYISDAIAGTDVSSANLSTSLFDLALSTDNLSSNAITDISDFGPVLDSYSASAESLYSDLSVVTDIVQSSIILSELYDFISSTDFTTIPGSKILYDYGNVEETIVTLGILTGTADQSYASDISSASSLNSIKDFISAYDSLSSSGFYGSIDLVISEEQASATVPVIGVIDTLLGSDSRQLSLAQGLISDSSSFFDSTSSAVTAIAIEPITVFDTLLPNPILIVETDSIIASDEVTNPTKYILADFGLISEEIGIIGVIAQASDSSSLTDFMSLNTVVAGTQDTGVVEDTGTASGVTFLEDISQSSDGATSQGFSGVYDYASFMDAALPIIQSLLISDFSTLSDRVGFPPQYILMDNAAIQENAEVVGLVLTINDVTYLSDTVSSYSVIAAPDDASHVSDIDTEVTLPVFTDYSSISDTQVISNFTYASGFVATGMTVRAPLYGKLISHLIVTIPGESYTAPDYSGARLNISMGPILTATDPYGKSRIAEGAIIDVVPKGTDMNGIAIGNGLVTAVVGNTGKVTIRVPFGPKYRWTYRIFYPKGTMDPNAEVITVNDLPLDQGEYEF